MSSKRVCAACGLALGRKRSCPKCSEKVEYIPPGIEVKSLPEPALPAPPPDDLATRLAKRIGASIGATLMSDAPTAGAVVGEILGEYMLGKVRRKRRKRA